MCIDKGYRCIPVSNMKSLYLILRLADVCTDTNNDNDDVKDDTSNATTKHDVQNMIVTGLFGITLNEPKILSIGGWNTLVVQTDWVEYTRGTDLLIVT